MRKKQSNPPPPEDVERPRAPPPPPPPPAPVSPCSCCQCKTGRDRVEYLEHRIAERLMQIECAQGRVAFMIDLFGRHGRAEFNRLSMIYPEVLL